MQSPTPTSEEIATPESVEVAQLDTADSFETFKAMKAGTYKAPEPEPEVKKEEASEEKSVTEADPDAAKESQEKSEEAKSDEEAKPEDKSGEEPKSRRKPDAESRIRELTHERNIARDENASLKARLKDLETAPVEAKEPAKPVRPKLSEFAYDEDKFNAALDEYEGKAQAYREFQSSKTAREEAGKQASQRARQSFDAELAKVVKENPGFNPASGYPLSQETVSVLVSMPDGEGAHVAHYLSKHLSLAETLFNVKDAGVLSYHLGRIAGRLEQSSAAKADSEKTPDKQATSTKALPKPPATLKGSADSDDDNLDEATDLEDYRRRKKAASKGR